MSGLFGGNRQLFWSDCFFSIRWFDVECHEGNGGNSELFNENDVTILNEQILLLWGLIFKIYKSIKFLLLIIHSHFRLSEDHLHKIETYSVILLVLNHSSWCLKVYKLWFECLESGNILITLVFPCLYEFLASLGSLTFTW